MRLFWQLIGVAVMATAMQVGCAAPGEDENYKIIGEDEDPAQIPGDPYTSAKPGTVAPIEPVPRDGHTLGASDERPAPAPLDTAAAPAPPTATTATTHGTELAVEVADEEVPLQGHTEVPIDPSPDPGAPSLRGLDRSHWNHVAIGPEDGRPHHNPNFFNDVTIFHENPAVQIGTDPVETLEGAQAANHDRTNLLGAVVQPLKVWSDTILFLFRAIATPPWSDTTSSLIPAETSNN